MARPQVLICGEIEHAQKELDDSVGAVADLLTLDVKDRSEFAKACSTGGKYSSIVAIYRHNHSAAQVGIFDRELVSLLPASLKVICHNGAGYDQVDVQACKERGIWVSHTPGSVDAATADVAMFLILSSLRLFWSVQSNARAGNWDKGIPLTHDPDGKTLGIVGMGGIGSALARRAEAFGMKIAYHNRRPRPDTPQQYEYVATLEELLRRSDVISLNLPLNEKTKGSFGKAQFAGMKDKSVLVNTARGGVVDQEALIDALKSGKLYSAGLDVFPDEPHIDPRLIEMPNVTLLPHIGTATIESRKKMEMQTFDSILSALKRDDYKPDYLVAEHK